MKRCWALLGLVFAIGVLSLSSCGGSGGGSGFRDRLVLTRETGLVERDLSSGKEHLLVPQPSDATLVEPAASPDGKQIVYIKAESDLTVTLWIADAGGANAKRLVPDSRLVSFARPRYSPDGRYLVLGAAGQGDFSRAPSMPAELVSRLPVDTTVSNVDRMNVDRMNGLPEDIWLIDMQTGEPRRLADLDIDSPSSAWSSDSKRIFALGDKGLYEIDPNGGEQRLADGMFHAQLDWLAAK